MGHSDIVTGKVVIGGRPVTKSIPVVEFGLNQAHNVLLKGITYPSGIRSSVAQSIRPATALIMLVKSPASKYSEKWERAVRYDT
ncbi:hypothetical protein O3M35_000503 [Rhynocoris fuscipes]|uniref:Uncharacterized protein n=1 Tax=Rhynocoris fuscipes TaxID=488301 RepID=A0AAW1DMR5_9HEMI